MSIFKDVDVGSDDKTFDPNTFNKLVKVEFMLDVDDLHESEDLDEHLQRLASELLSKTEPTR